MKLVTKFSCFPFSHVSLIQPFFLFSGLEGRESTCNVGHGGSIPGSGRSPGEGNGNPLQYSCPENPVDRGAWQAIVHGSQRVVCE